ncbi:MAG: DUF4190 domain-containing protein [Planctomycetes bacterium]|nr:DUF4190 domain-containing protein [Planctomycetota bacterium]
MATIRVTCPACNTTLEIDKKHEGEEIECGNCLEVFKATEPKRGDGDDPKIVVILSSPVPKKARADRPAKRRRRDEDEYDDDDDYAPPPQRRRGSGPGDGAAVAALILSLVAFVGFCCWPMSGPFAVLAIVLGCAGLKSETNRALAVSGIVVGVLVLIALATLFAVGFGGGFGPVLFR